MSHVLARRLGVAALTGALISSGALLAAPAGASPATLGATPAAAVAPPTGSVPVESGADWLIGQLSDAGVMDSPFGGVNDGLTIDVALALDAVGRDAEARNVADAFVPQVADYTAPDDEISAGSTAKTAVLAKTVGLNPEAYAGVDLIDRLEGRIDTTGPLVGRIKDETADPTQDIANVFGQIFAVAALTDASSTKAGAATDFLLEQQCDSGFFRLSFSKKSADNQSCTANEKASPDATALAVINLQPFVETNPQIATAVSDAVTWLKTNQKADGSIGGDEFVSASNANSTGLAGWAFGVTGADDAAAEAASWLRKLQVDDQTDCDTNLSANVGAIGYSEAAFAKVCKDGFKRKTDYQQWHIATAQALPALQFLAPPATGDAAAEPTADWLLGQLTDGIIRNDEFDFDDVGLSIDVGFGLQSIGREQDAQTVAAAVASRVDGYTAADPSIYASATAKAASFAQTVDRDPAAFGGVNLIERLEGRVSTDASIAGRLEDKEDPAYPGDYANVIGQSFAAKALTTASSDKSDSAMEFLLDQQCDAGYFRLDFSVKTAADQTCQGGVAAGDSPADTDVTALAVLQLQPLEADPVVKAAVDEAVAWLKDNQQADGSFGGGTATEAPNTNSTGLAGAALGLTGETEASSGAATWVRARQVKEISGCGLPLAKDNGAVAYDDSALTTARAKGITVATRDQWRRASAQSLAALQYAPVGSVSAEPTLAACGRSGFVKAKSKQIVKIAGLRAGDSATLTGHGVTKTVLGTGDLVKVKVKLPKKTGKRVYTVRRGNDSERVTFRALAAKKLKVTLSKKTKKRGKKSKVIARGLASGESVKARYRGRVIGKGAANKNGVYKTKFKVGRKKGTFKVVVRGRFANRKGAVKQRVK